MHGVTEALIREWLDDIQREQHAEDGFTSRELAAMLDVSQNAAKDRIRALLEGGRLEPVRVTRTRMDGIVQTTTGYRVVDAEAA